MQKNEKNVDSNSISKVTNQKTKTLVYLYYKPEKLELYLLLLMLFLVYFSKTHSY